MDDGDEPSKGQGRGRGRGETAAGAAAAAGRGRGRGRGRGSAGASPAQPGSLTQQQDKSGLDDKIDLLIQEESRKRQRMMTNDGNGRDLVDDEAQQPSAEEVAKLMGFEAFGSTKGQLVDTNVSTAAKGGRAPRQFRKARQYMNRKGGFNQLLSD